MRTIVVNNQKGGVGKTTIAVHLAWHFVEAGARVLFVDLDAQANATATLTNHGADDRWHATAIGAAADLFSSDAEISVATAPFQIFTASARLNSIDAALDPAIAALRTHFPTLAKASDICVIDTPPAFGARNLGALLVCDHLLAPVQLEDYALNGVNDLLKAVAVAERLRGGKLDFLGLLPSQFRANSTLHRRNLEALVQDLGRTNLLFPAYLSQRQGYVDAVARSQPVWTIRDNSAAAVAGREMRHVLGLIAERIGGRA